MRLIPKLLPQTDEQRRAKQESALIAMEAQIGGELFGKLPKGRSRQFFCLDKHTWIWHEEWQDSGQHRAVTTRYEVRPDGILKMQDGKQYQRLSDDEARNLYKAAELYRQKVGNAYRQMLQVA
jgi:predicted transcriptional regulator